MIHGSSRGITWPLMGRLSTSTEIVQANCETTCTAGRGLWTAWTKNAMPLALQKDVRVQHKQIKNSMKNTWIITCINTWPLALMGQPRKFSGRIGKPRTRPSVDCGLPEQRMPCFPGRALSLQHKQIKIVRKVHWPSHGRCRWKKKLAKWIATAVPRPGHKGKKTIVNSVK